ncbi:MAG TPA: hypothetical protein VJ301_07720, partial [Propionibacteriaceae bacterium]|nr:hypothetical protein [Propionibacteriaceae bacterium]
LWGGGRSSIRRWVRQDPDFGKIAGNVSVALGGVGLPAAMVMLVDQAANQFHGILYWLVDVRLINVVRRTIERLREDKY